MSLMLNDLGVDPYEWFDNPLENPRPEEEVADDWFVETPEIKEETPHHIAYDIATSKYNPFAVGGSESIHDFEGGSEKIQSI